jgi:probable addiction module antidote protein
MPKVTVTDFDPVEYLTDDEIIGEYLTAALEDPNPDVFLDALGDAARAKGIGRIAADAGLGGESLDADQSPEAKPSYDALVKVMGSLSLQITLSGVSPAHERRPGRRNPRGRGDRPAGG